METVVLQGKSKEDLKLLTDLAKKGRNLGDTSGKFYLIPPDFYPKMHPEKRPSF